MKRKVQAAERLWATYSSASKPDGWKPLLLQHQALSQGCPSCCDPAPEPGKFSASRWRWTEAVISDSRACGWKPWCAGRWVARGSAVPAWRDAASHKGWAQGSGGRSRCLRLKSAATHQSKGALSGWPGTSWTRESALASSPPPGNYY